MKLYRIEDNYEVKFLPTVVPYKATKSKKCYMVKTSRWHTRGKAYPFERVDGERGFFFTTEAGAWDGYITSLARRQKIAGQEMQEIGRKILLAQARRGGA